MIHRANFALHPDLHYMQISPLSLFLTKICLTRSEVTHVASFALHPDFFTASFSSQKFVLKKKKKEAIPWANFAWIPSDISGKRWLRSLCWCQSPSLSVKFICSSPYCWCACSMSHQREKTQLLHITWDRWKAMMMTGSDMSFYSVCDHSQAQKGKF